MKNAALKMFVATALVSAGWIGTAQAESADEGAIVHRVTPLSDALTPRRHVEALPNGLLAIGGHVPAPTATQRPARPINAHGLLAVDAETIAHSRNARAPYVVAERRLRVLDGAVARLVRVTRPEVAAGLLPIDGPRIIASRNARRAQRLLAVDAEVLHRSRMARSLALR